MNSIRRLGLEHLGESTTANELDVVEIVHQILGCFDVRLLQVIMNFVQSQEAIVGVGMEVGCLIHLW